MQATTLKIRINLSHAKAIRRSRELLKLTRKELASRLGISFQAVEKYESGRAIIDEEKLQSIIGALELSPEEYQKIRRGKGIGLKRKVKAVFSNQERRSYKKIITKEVRVIKILRQMKNLTQDQASAVCGYSRPSIGHIENGRIELDEDRIKHIVSSYGLEMNNFNRLMKEEVLRDEILDACYSKMIQLPEEKLKLVQSVLANL
ncbi:MAG TPA: helix-turn-helix transcriptional regulator [Bacteriovoracaceae bacterium]|nr:helix-turn-helix transcriptional regulator [Bacteriovoracaceae bacterium]